MVEEKQQKLNAKATLGEEVILYHGSVDEFSVFSFEKGGKTNGAYGYGVYLTPNKELASMYTTSSKQPNGFIYEVSVKLAHTLSLNQLTVDEKKVRSVLTILQPTHDILSNFGDVTYSGFDNVMDMAVATFMSEKNDVDMLNSIANSIGDQVATSKAFFTVGGYTHIGAEELTYLEDRVYVVIDPSHVQILGYEKTEWGKVVGDFQSNHNYEKMGEDMVKQGEQTKDQEDEYEME